MVRVNLSEAGKRLPDLVEAALHGEQIIISRAGRDIVQLTPIVTPRRRQFGSARGMIIMAGAFDAPLDDFEPYSA